MKAWYVVQAKPRQEQTAEINLLQQQYETYLPQTLIDKRIVKNLHRITEPLFPGYLFVYLSDQTDDWRPIKSTKGVMSLISFGNIPAKVPIEIIDALKKNESDQGVHEVFQSDYKTGDPVRIISRPFELVEAIVKTVSKDRIFLIMKILGNETEMEVGYEDIEPSVRTPRTTAFVNSSTPGE